MGAARAFIEAQGHASFSVNDIVEGAGVSRRTVFNHFTSLDEIVKTVCQQVIDEVISSTGALDGTACELAGSCQQIGEVFDAIAGILLRADFRPGIAYMSKALLTKAGHDVALTAEVFSNATGRLRELASCLGPELDPLDIDFMIGSLMTGLAIIAQRWLEEAKGSLGQHSKEIWDDYMEAMTTTIRRGYGAGRK